MLPSRNNKSARLDRIFAGIPLGKHATAVWARKNKNTHSILRGFMHLITRHVICQAGLAKAFEQETLTKEGNREKGFLARPANNLFPDAL